MEGVLEGALTLCLCKLMCSVLFLPAVRGSMSSVSLCCNCLLIFTDLAITIFLALLWLDVPWLTPLPVPSDVVCLRFTLFLGQTYGTVLVLTTPLVAMELAFRLQWLQTVGMKAEGKEMQNEMGGGLLDPVVLEIDSEEEGRESNSLERKELLTCAVGFFCCLLVWSICGLCGGQNWKGDELSVKTCLRSGSSFSTCLPRLLTVSAPMGRELSWALPTYALLLGLTGSLSLLTVKLANRLTHQQQQTATSTTGVRKECVGSQLIQTRPTLCMTMNHIACVSKTQAVDSEKTSDSCGVHSTQFTNIKQHLLCPGINPLHWSHRFSLAKSCELKRERIKLFTILGYGLPQKQTSQQPHTVELHSISSPYLCSRMRLPSQPCRSQSWQSLTGSPCLGADILTGLLCGLLVCGFPVILSANILLIRCLETLMIYTLKLLLCLSHIKYEPV